MGSSFQVSVIIPVYNAAIFISKAVESVESLLEVGEIILVEDASTDNSLEICKQLVFRYAKVILFQHPDKENHGAGASRNLGIQKANYEFIAFLDADDYYLPNRFVKDKELLLKYPAIDGVYNALGIHYYSENAKKIFIDAGFKYQEFLTLSEAIAPEELFFVLFNQHVYVKGEFSTITITVRKNIFKKVGIFNTKLRLKQDTHLWRRMAAKCQLMAGNIKEAVAIRGVHDNNRMVNIQEHKKNDIIWWNDLRKWFKKEKIKKEYMLCFELSYLYYIINSKTLIKSLILFIFFFGTHPKYINSRYSYFDIYFLDLFGRNWLSLHFISFKNRIIS